MARPSLIFLFKYRDRIDCGLFIGIKMIIYILQALAVFCCSCITAWMMNRCPLLTLWKRPPSDIKYPIRARMGQAIRAMILSLIILSPVWFYVNNGEFTSINDPLFISLLLFVLCFLLPPQLQHPTTPHLIVNKNIFTNTYSVHLITPNIPLNKPVYKELFILLEQLHIQCANKVIMSSPLFYNSNDSLRDLTFLTKRLKKQGITLTHRQIKWHEDVLSRFSLFLSRHIFHRKDKEVQELKTQWHRITLTFH